MEALIYYSAGNEEKEKQLEALARRAGYTLFSVSPLQTGQLIGYLAKVEGYTETPLSLLELPPQIGEEMLLLSGFAGERLDAVLDALREGKLGVSLKAVVTQHNVSWRLADLYRELTAEREQLRKKAR
ncbi:MAG: DUF3783 domain-containing protein [Eubacteriales bacterium]|nr:DUF3783 domain-containing protein [Eubacteriales bacterium]